MLERALLGELQSRLAPEVAILLEKQIETINLVQRHSRNREVCCYSMRGGKMQRNPEFRFPCHDEEANFASIQFRCKGVEGLLRANFVAVNGYLFNILFPRRAAPEIGDVSDLEIVSFVPKIDLGQPSIRPVLTPLDPARAILPPWLNSLANRYGITRMFVPLDAETRAKQLARIEATLPQDYLEASEACEGFTLGRCDVLGLSEIHGVSLSEADYYVLATLEGGGVLAVQSGSGNGRIEYFEQDCEESLQYFASLYAALKHVAVARNRHEMETNDLPFEQHLREAGWRETKPFVYEKGD